MNHNHHITRPSPRHGLHNVRAAHASSPHRRYTGIANENAIGDNGPASDIEGDMTLQDDPIHMQMQERLAHTLPKIAQLFDSLPATGTDQPPTYTNASSHETATTSGAAKTPPATAPSKAANAPRIIDDDYGDDDEGDDDNQDNSRQHDQSPLLAKAKPYINGPTPSLLHRSPSQSLRLSTARPSFSADQKKDVENVRKQLEEHKTAAEDEAKRTFHTMFYTFEADRHAMLEQQKLDELDRQMESEMTNGSQSKTESGQANGAAGQGSLSSADLGASSLTLKHLIARIDAQRNRVQANDTQLRSLISEVRKGRSKWASEDKVGQEELYEAAEKVLMELKAMTEYSAPFLQRVNKRDAPDYFHIIKHPMDLGTMIKKLKALQYKSKKEFVGDLTSIWSNCLTYNADPAHPLRKKALYMRKETDKLVPLIPDITVRDRAEVEAEEERNNALENGLDGGEESDDDLPIMASRGRKAPSKGKPDGTAKPRVRDQPDSLDTTMTDASKPLIGASASSLRNEFLRADSETGDAISNGFATPPPAGSATPQTNGMQADSMMDVIDVDAATSAMPAQDELDENDAEYITWRQVTKKDRATAAAARNRLFQNDRINPDEPALLRNKAGMRRWLRQQKQYGGDEYSYVSHKLAQDVENAVGESLAEGIEQDQDRTLPDYYETLTAIPNLARHLGWLEDSEGHVVSHNESFLRLFPTGQFRAPDSILASRVAANMKQMQDSRKICAKIGVVKQMQIQAQTYQNQFVKYEPEPFLEQEIEPLAVSDSGPIMAPWLCRAAFQRSVGRIFYHAGFEDFQPAALDAVTDIATHYFTKLTTSLTTYMQTPRTEEGTEKFTCEEQVLHCLYDNGLDIETLDSYVMDDVERTGQKLVAVHDRLKSHLADLLRPALGDGIGADGEGAFTDGSEQFVGGDFAEDIDEDFFGFKELGLADELGLQGLSVPLHLLQNRVHNAYAGGQQVSSNASGLAFPIPEPYEPITTENLSHQLSIVREFFANKLAANNGRGLIEDADLPPKQRFPKPRLGPTGKISSPRKRPIREQQQLAKKKRKLEESLVNGTGVGGQVKNETSGTSVPGSTNGNAFAVKPMKPLRLDMPTPSIDVDGLGAKDKSGQGMNGILPDPEKADLNTTKGPMISPESIAAN